MCDQEEILKKDLPSNVRAVTPERRACDEEEILKKDLFAVAELSAGAQVVDIAAVPREPLTDLCHRIKHQLATDHVRCPEAGASGLQNELRSTASPLRSLLAAGFSRLVTIEATRGLDKYGKFEFDGLFLPYLRDILFSAFGIEPSDVFHPEQIVQVLKDEPSSLFCFLDSQLIPNPDAQRLRSLTQEHHRVLFCGQVERSDRHDVPTRNSDKYMHASKPRIKAQLVVVQGKPEGKVIPLAGPYFKIGRGEACHLRPNSEQVSREHAEFTLDAHSVHVRDLGSHNGTFVNGKALTSELHRLKDRDLVTIGPLTFAVSILSTPVPAAKPVPPPTQVDKESPEDIESWLIGPGGREPSDDSSKVSLATVEIGFSPKPPPREREEHERDSPADDEPDVPQESAVDDLIDESNPFHAAKVARKEQADAQQSEQSPRADQSASDPAGDILRRLMDRRRAEKSS